MPHERNEGQETQDILLDDLRKKLDRIVSRIPILDDKGVLKYMLHESVLFKVITILPSCPRISCHESNPLWKFIPGLK